VIGEVTDFIDVILVETADGKLTVTIDNRLSKDSPAAVGNLLL
jgi:hypothetical protein